MPELRIDLSDQAAELLAQIAKRGLWGTTKEEVATRLVDEALIVRFVEPVRYGVAIAKEKRDGH